MISIKTPQCRPYFHGVIKVYLKTMAGKMDRKIEVFMYIRTITDFERH
jgi:hypothetical protein